MQHYELCIRNPNLENLSYVIAIANLEEKHDRSAPSNYHWKVLKCRMIIFSNSSILACPDKDDVKQVHVIFNKFGEHYDKLNSLFVKFSLSQNGAIRKPTPEIYQKCFQYTMTAKLAPIWNVLGHCYLINNRDFLTASTPQDGVQYNISSNENNTTLELKPVKINLIRSDDDYVPGEWVRVFPSHFKATIDNIYDSIPESGKFKSYKDLKRHWKNIHGYRLPEEEGTYCTIQFWRGEPLTYPKLCVTRHFPVITPIPIPAEKIILARFVSCLQNKMSNVLGEPLMLQANLSEQINAIHDSNNEKISETQAVSLCTPTQYPRYNKF